MKSSIIYYSQTNHTKTMANLIKKGMQEEGISTRCFSIERIDKKWLEESKCIIIGTPTYYADVAGKVKTFLEGLGKYNVKGKLGGAFATEKYIQGGADIAIQTILRHMLVSGMMVYSSGGSEMPVIHLGPVAVNEIKSTDDVFKNYGVRMAKQLKKLYKEEDKEE